MVWLNAWWAQSSEHCRRCVVRMWQTGTYASNKFYTGTADVQVQTVNLPSKFCTVSILDLRKKTKASILSSTKEAREFELAIALAARAERVVPRMVTEEQKFKTGDWVLLRRGNQPKGSKFEARMWLGPYKVRTVQHPHYELENEPGRRSRKPVHVRRLRLYV